jgi:hypothetical protein
LSHSHSERERRGEKDGGGRRGEGREERGVRGREERGARERGRGIEREKEERILEKASNVYRSPPYTVNASCRYPFSVSFTI